MRTVLADLWDRLRTSLWFVPAIMAVAAAALAFVLVRAQDWITDDWMYRTRWLATGDPEGSRQILATIAGSIITVTGVIFSVTLVALSLASQQFGPRLLRTFMRDRGNQFVLGTFIGTFIYAMLVLRVVQENENETNIPYLAVTFAVVLALGALAVLIFFIHHVVSSIQADSIILHVSHELHETMDHLYPPPHEADDNTAHSGTAAELDESELPQPREVKAAKAGYVRALNTAGLIEVAEKHDLVIHITERPGRFVINGRTVALVHGNAEHDHAMREHIDHRIRNCLLIGPARTAEQDIEFSVAQLVEIAVRSLSPSLNDPFTAMTCLDRLGEAIADLGKREVPKVQQCRSDGRLRLLIDRPNFAGMVNLAFDQIRQNARSKPAVIIRMLEVITQVVQCLHNRPACFAPLLNQARMVVAGAEEAVAEAHDRDAIAVSYQDLLAATESAQP